MSEGQIEIYDAGFTLPGSFGLRIGAGGRKSFFLIFRLNGKRKRLTLGYWPILDLATARAMAVDYLSQVADGRDPASELRRYKSLPTFKTVAHRYIEEVASERCKNSTIREYRRIIEKELLPYWADISIADLGIQDITQLLADCALDRGRLTMANRIRAVLSGIMEFAVTRGWIAVNPVRSTEKLLEEPRELARLSETELLQVWNQLTKRTERTALALTFLFLTGQRLQDVVRMRWREIQIDVWLPLGDHTRPIPLHPQLISYLRGLQKKASHNDFVFADKDGTPPRDLRKICKELSRQAAIAELNPSMIRRSLEQQFRELGARPEVIAYLFSRTTALKQLLQSNTHEQLFIDSQRILNKWQRKLQGLKEPEPSTGAKVIPLFR